MNRTVMTTAHIARNKMATEGEQPPIPEEMSSEEARRYLIRFLGQQDLDKHEEIYEELARE